MRQALLALMAVTLAACQSMPPSPGVSTADPGTAIQDWVTAVNTCDVDRVAMLYASDAVLWGTVSPVIISSPVGVRQYFERACAPNPKLKVALGEQMLRAYGDTRSTQGHTRSRCFLRANPFSFPPGIASPTARRMADGSSLIITPRRCLLPPLFANEVGPCRHSGRGQNSINQRRKGEPVNSRNA